MRNPTPSLVIDARPRGPKGPLAGELIQGRCVLAHLLDIAQTIDDAPVVIHARLEDHRRLQDLILDRPSARYTLATGSPSEGAAVLRTDRLYDPEWLRRALRRGKDPESAVVWRLDQPHGLTGAEDELTRRQSYQPLGRYWALAPAKRLAKALCPTSIRPNGVTIASATLVLGASALVAFAGPGVVAHLATALALAVALVLDTADGHLARLQGTASSFGRWLDATLDELGDMTLHAAIAWAAFVKGGGHPGWLLLGMAYGMGKYLFVTTSVPIEPQGKAAGGAGSPHVSTKSSPTSVLRPPSTLVSMVRLVGHADVRWHLWILLAALGRLDVALAAYAAYFPARTLAGAARKVVDRA